jgi:hypothetical protein
MTHLLELCIPLSESVSLTRDDRQNGGVRGGREGDRGITNRLLLDVI